jgi:hypothetical protein
MRYVSIAADGSATLEDTTSGWRYDCALYAMSEGYDCATVHAPGDEFTVTFDSTAECVKTAYIGNGTGDTICSYNPCVPTAP